jgi:excisionase family DNA binding protein
MQKRFLTRRELSQRLGIGERTIRTLMSRKVIPYISAGHRTVLFDESKVVSALERLETKAAA